MNSNRLDTLLKMYDEENHDSFVLFAIAKEYEYHKEYNRAIETYLKLKSIDQSYVGLYYQLAKIYEEIHDYDKALETYEEGINIAKKIADFHSLSELLNAKKNLEIEM